MRRTLFNLTIALVISGIIMTALPVKFTLAAEIIVPTQYGTIQEAINNANSGDTITVEEGIYNECLIIDKTLTLQGKDGELVTLEGNPMSPTDGISIIGTNGVTISNLTIRYYRFDIYLDNSHNNLIINNTLTHTGTRIDVDYCGIRASSSENNTIANNIIDGNEYGISLHSFSNGNII